MTHRECAEQIRLAEEYSRRVTAFHVHLEALRSAHSEHSEGRRHALEEARARSESAWEAWEQHVARHQCLGMFVAIPGPSHAQESSHPLLGKAADAALDLMLVADDERRFVDLNQAAADTLGLERAEIVGRRIDDFFVSARGETIPEAWGDFIAEGVQRGICELSAPGRPRRFEYRAKSNFAPGLHLSVLREIAEGAEE